MVSIIQTKFSSRSRGWIELSADAGCRSRIKLRLDHGLKNKEDSRRLSQASQSTSEESSRRSSQDRSRSIPPAANVYNIDLHDKAGLMAMFEDTLEVRVSDVPLTLSMSSVTGLADLAEDEIVPTPIPLEVSIFLKLICRSDIFFYLILQNPSEMFVTVFVTDCNVTHTFNTTNRWLINYFDFFSYSWKTYRSV